MSLNEKAAYPKLASQIRLGFALESKSELYLITFPEDIVNIGEETESSTKLFRRRQSPPLLTTANSGIIAAM